MVYSRSAREGVRRSRNHLGAASQFRATSMPYTPSEDEEDTLSTKSRWHRSLFDPSPGDLLVSPQPYFSHTVRSCTVGHVARTECEEAQVDERRLTVWR